MAERHERAEQELLEQLREIWPSDAPDRVRPVYEDIRTALRVPDVPYPFRFLAHWPPYLAYAVRQFSPFVRSLAFEAAADALRAEVAQALAATARRERFEPLRTLVLREHELVPKLLLILTAFAVGLRGRNTEPAPPLGTTLPHEEPPPVRPAELPRMVDERIAPLPDLRSLPDTARAALDELATLRGAPAVDDFSRALAITDAEALRQLVQLRQEQPGSALATLRTQIDELADRLVRRFTLPGAKVLPDFMVAEADVPVIRAAVEALQAVARESLLDVTLARLVLDGAEAARRSPYPVSQPVG